MVNLLDSACENPNVRLPLPIPKARIRPIVINLDWVLIAAWDLLAIPETGFDSQRVLMLLGAVQETICSC